jgi:hypothetical protein
MVHKTVTIRLLTSVTGSDYSYGAGQIVDAPEDIAADLIRGGHAVPEGGKPAERAEKQVSPQSATAEKRNKT